MESCNGYNTEELIDPIDFYNAVTNNMDKFSDNEKLTILRFFDKLADSVGFSNSVKYRLQFHITKKNLKMRASEIFDTKLGCTKVEILKDVAYLIRLSSSRWRFVIGDEIILDNISSEYAMKIVKDINSAFKGR